MDEVLAKSTAEAERRGIASPIPLARFHEHLVLANRIRLERSAEQKPYQASDLEPYGAFYAGLADGGLPLTDLLTCGRLCVAAAASLYWARTEPEEYGQMTALSAWMAENSGALFDQAVRTYASRVDPAQRLAMERRLLADALLTGDEVDTVAASLHQSAPSRLAVCVSSGGARTQWPPRLLPHGCLATRRGEDQVLLVPAAHDEDVGTLLGRVDEVTAALDLPGRARAIGVAVAAHRADVPRAYAEASRTCSLAAAHTLSRKPFYTAEDVLVLDGVLSAPRAQARLARVLDPLHGHPDLVDSLLALYRNDLDRTRTAAELFIARRTLTYRLDKIRTLTGLDPTSTCGIVALSTALTVAQLARDEERYPSIA
ncbi:PucR family transcriptional regulator [Actinokineospora guangxiensis]|uniref:PucR family transcriptional regulator n=1 Tax=Actinokineospora guangxiensis TaxID=1490288 RepID=A0ABW0ET47_9PSEU